MIISQQSKYSGEECFPLMKIKAKSNCLLFKLEKNQA